MFIFRNPSKYKVLKVTQMIVDMKQGGAQVRYGLGAIGSKMGYKMECKQPGFQGKIYGCTGVRYRDWNHTQWMKLDKFGYASLDSVLMMEFVLFSLFLQSWMYYTSETKTRCHGSK